MTVRGNITTFVGLTKTWINWRLWARPVRFLIPSAAVCISTLKGQRERELYRTERWSLGASGVMDSKTRHGTFTRSGESANDVWHMDNFSYGIDHFLIRIVPLKAAILEGFQPLADVKCEWCLSRKKKKRRPRQRGEYWLPQGHRSWFLLQFLLMYNCQL